MVQLPRKMRESTVRVPIEPTSVRTPSFITPIIILPYKTIFLYIVSIKIITGSIIRTFTINTPNNTNKMCWYNYVG